MVRAGVVSHPSEWQFGGYNEIQNPRGKCAVIAYEKLAELSGFALYDNFRESHCDLVTELLSNVISRQAWWSESIAVGSESFVEAIKQRLGFRAKGRKIKEANEDFQLKEDIETYVTDSDWKNCDIERQNTYFVGVNNESSAC
jgi:putative transposase